MIAPRQEYACGFVFTETNDSLLLLIEKTGPDFQRGKLNGLGGKIEKGETPGAAMVREFHEETNMRLPIERWRYFCRFGNAAQAYTVHFFAARMHRALMRPLPIQSAEGAIDVFPVNQLYRLKIMPELSWLVPLALDKAAPFCVCIARV